MAAQVLLLLLPLISNIHAEVVMGAGSVLSFSMDNAADFCSVSRWTGEGIELLWNSSRSFYWMHPLNASHSGQYQEQCWTGGNLTLERNTTLLVCDDQNMRDHGFYLDVAETVELTCDGVGPNQSVQWAFETYRREDLVLIDDETPSEYKHQLVKNKPSLQLTVDRPSVGTFYYCLQKKQQGCHLHSRFSVQMLPEFIFHFVGESLELNCAGGSGNQTPMWWIYNLLWLQSKSLNSTLMFPSLTLVHSGEYTCERNASNSESYRLFVCPESGPPGVLLFTGGENLTLHCGDWNRTYDVNWFVRSNRTGGRVFNIDAYRRREMYLSYTSLVVRNVSLQDGGRFWCVVMRHDLCVFTSETLVMFREPGVDHHLVRPVLLSVVMVTMLCVVAAVMVWRSRRRQQLPAAVEEIEMTHLSPESEPT